MKLSPCELIKKFRFLQKFQDQKWIAENSIHQDIDFKEVPMHCTFLLINELKKFLEATKFNNGYEVFLSTKVRLEQIEDLLLYFCEDSDFVKSMKGTNL